MADRLPTQVLTRRSFLFALASATCLKINGPALAQEDQFQPFSFAFISDVHLTTGQPDGFRMLQQSQLFLQDCVKTLNNQKLDFVVFGGDQVEYPGQDDSHWQLFLDVLQQLSCPWTFVLGESDVSGPTVVNKMATYGPDWKGKGIETDKSYWSQSPLSGVHIIGLDTSKPNTTAGDLSSEQLDWLKSDLAANQNKFTMVFSHHPLLVPPPFDAGPPWDDYVTPQGASAREILGSSKNVRLAVSGHLNISKIQRERDIWYVSCPSLAVYPCAFKIFHVTSSRITVETYQVSYPALVKKAKLALIGSNLAYKYNEAKPALFLQIAEGTSEDQNIVLPLSAKGVMQAPAKKKKEKHKKEREPSEKPQKKSKPERPAGKSKADDVPDVINPCTY